MTERCVWSVLRAVAGILIAIADCRDRLAELGVDVDSFLESATEFKEQLEELD